MIGFVEVELIQLISAVVPMPAPEQSAWAVSIPVAILLIVLGISAITVRALRRR